MLARGSSCIPLPTSSPVLARRALAPVAADRLGRRQRRRRAGLVRIALRVHHGEGFEEGLVVDHLQPAAAAALGVPHLRRAAQAMTPFRLARRARRVGCAPEPPAAARSSACPAACSRISARHGTHRPSPHLRSATIATVSAVSHSAQKGHRRMWVWQAPSTSSSQTPQALRRMERCA